MLSEEMCLNVCAFACILIVIALLQIAHNGINVDVKVVLEQEEQEDEDDWWRNPQQEEVE